MQLIKTIKKNTILLFIITILVLYFVLKDNFNQVIKALASMNVIYILIAILFYIIYIFLKSIVNYLTVNDDSKISLHEAFKHDLIVQFFNGITPFSTGGQPMEIYMLTEHKISVAKATNISIQNFIFYQIALVIYGVVAVGYNFIFHIFPKTPFLRKLVLIGFLINTLVAIFLITIMISDKVTKKLIKNIFKIIKKHNIIKNSDELEDKVLDKLNEFHETAKVLKHRKNLIITGVLLHIVSLTCYYMIPLFIMFSLGDFTSLTVIETLAASAYVLLMGSFVPVPGASGGIEFGFLQFYGNFIGNDVISAVLIVWRFVTYYLGMIIGALVFSLEKKVK